MRENEEKRSVESYDLQYINSINIPSNFRENCFKTKKNFEFGTVNMFVGKNGSGKTSVLEGIELVITGRVRKAMNVYRQYGDVTAINCTINNGQKIAKPDLSEEVYRRANTWYHKKDGDPKNLNSEFHLYNYFTSADPFVFAYLGEDNTLGRKLFQILFGEDALNYYENIEKYRERILYLEKCVKNQIHEEEQLLETYGDGQREMRKIWINFVKRVENYPINFDINSNMQETVFTLRECLEICKEIPDKSREVKKVKSYKTCEKIALQKQKISLINKKLDECENEQKKNRDRIISVLHNNSQIEEVGELVQDNEKLKLKEEALTQERSQIEKELANNNLVLEINKLYYEAEKIINMKSKRMTVQELSNRLHNIDNILKEYHWESLDEKYEALKERLLQDKNKVNKLQEMKRSLDALRKPDVYLNKYVGNNLKEISELFLKLQSPKEYTGLALNKEKELTGIRGNKNVPLYMMSSGQRVAAVMALFLSVHLTGDNIPNIIMLDEPISHIDELNILSLFDLLRELVIKDNKQLFFTTSTREIARLFERKFSFLNEKYKEFHFERRGDEETVVSCRSNLYDNIDRKREIETII